MRVMEGDGGKGEEKGEGREEKGRENETPVQTHSGLATPGPLWSLTTQQPVPSIQQHLGFTKSQCASPRLPEMVVCSLLGQSQALAHPSVGHWAWGSCPAAQSLHGSLLLSPRACAAQ